MKSIITTFIWSLILCVSLPAQNNKTKTLTNTYQLPSSKEVTLNLKFAGDIKVSTWNKSEVGLHSILTYREEKLLDAHEIDVKNPSGKLVIETGFKEGAFKGKEDHQCWGCDSEDQDCQCLEFDYEVFLPEGVKLKLETISGNIEIREVNGPMQVKSISGFVDLGLKERMATNIELNSVTGQIYTDFDIDLEEGSTAWSKRVETSINGGGPVIALETVSGNIFLRKR